jgi:hypothetical protein
MYHQLAEKMKFTAERQEALKNLVIDENQPGTILHDFGVLLDILREDNQTLTASYQLPMNLLTQINTSLKSPIQHGLKRPQQKSYPHIHGLYLLVRASGLTFVEEAGKKPVLIVDEEAYKRWLSLNPTERYGSLLEAWLLRGDVSILGERSRFGGLPDNLDQILRFIARCPDNGLQIAGNQDAEKRLNYSPETHNLGLLDLFGLVAVQAGSSQPGKGWQIERIDQTAIGNALLALLYSELFEDFLSILGDESGESFGRLHKKLHPYFPKWKNNFTAPKAPFRDGTHIFKVSLGSVWRRIAIQAKQSLGVLASAILNSVDFDHDHLYEFSYRNRFGVAESIYHDYMDEPPFASEVMVGEVPLKIGQAMTFLFDFGDNWEFDVLLEKVDPDRTVKVVEVIETHGKPPEQYRYW